MSHYLDSDSKLIFHIAAFVSLAEVWVVNLPWLVDFYHLTYWLNELISFELWDYPLTTPLVYQGIFILLGTLLWILPYRLLSFLKPLKAIPYLWILSLGIFALQLYLSPPYYDEVTLLPRWEFLLRGQMLSHLVIPALFHYYFSCNTTKSIVFGPKKPIGRAAK